MITTMFFVLVPFLKRALRIVIHLARNAEKGGGGLMWIILPNLKHSFISPILVPVPDQDSRSRFQIPDFRIFHTPITIILIIYQNGNTSEVLVGMVCRMSDWFWVLILQVAISFRTWCACSALVGFPTECGCWHNLPPPNFSWVEMW